MTNKRNHRADHTGTQRRVFDNNKKRILMYAKANSIPCALCGAPIDYDLKYPERYSATIDHIIPLSKGGHPSAADNLQIAHFICNVRKSNRPLINKTQPSATNTMDLPQHIDWSKYDGGYDEEQYTD